MSEHDEQCTLFQWAHTFETQYPDLALLYANPNAGKRTKFQGAWMVAEGLKAGIPDVHLPVARHCFYGMYIEMKFGKNKPTKAQQWWLDILTNQNYYCVVCYSFEAARDEICSYLDIDPEWSAEGMA